MNTRTLISLAAVALMAAACTQESSISDNSPVAVSITAGVDGPVTRAIDDKWDADHIGVMVTDAPASDMEAMYKNVEYSTTATGELQADFTPRDAAQAIFFQDQDETVTFAAYAPYQPSAANALPGTNGLIDADTRVQTNAGEQKAIDFLYAAGATATKSAPQVTFADVAGEGDYSFHHRMTRLILILQPSAAAGFAATDIDKITKVVVGGLKHVGTFDVTTGKTNLTGDVVDDWDIFGNVSAPGNGERTYTMILFPQPKKADGSANKLSLAVTLGGNVYKNLQDITPALEPGKSYEYTITIKKKGLAVSGSTITGWGNGGSGQIDAEMQ